MLAAAAALGLLAAASASGLISAPPDPGPSVGAPDAAKDQAARAYGKLPLHFEANRGQTDSEVDFLSRGAGYTLFLTPREAVLSLTKTAGPPRSGSPGPRPKDGKAARAVLRMQMVGANPKPKAAGLEQLPGVSNYLAGSDPKRWHTGIPHFAKAKYEDVYPGTDVVYYGKQGQLEYDFVLKPGADPGRIALAFKGADKLAIDRQGDLIAHTRAGKINQPKPFIYQEVGGRRQAVSGGFVLGAGNRVAFQVGAYDRTKPLVIDPALVYSTYLGGVDSDEGTAIAVDSSGSAYVTGITRSPDFPTRNPINGGPARNTDAFVAKLNPQGSALAYSTYLGGDSFELASNGIAVDASGAAYVVGRTGRSASETDFPTTPGAFDTSCDLHPEEGFCVDAFVAKLAPDGSSLVYSTLLGGAGFGDEPHGVAVDASGEAYVAGDTDSRDFPTARANQPTYAGGDSDAFLTKVNRDGSALAYSTYLGGGGEDRGRGIAVEALTGRPYVTGFTGSSDFPATAGAFDRSCGTDGNCTDGPDGFVARFRSDGAALAYSTYLGGHGFDQGHAIALGRSGSDSGKAYVFGTTGSNDFPTSPGAYDRDRNCDAGGECRADAFVTKLDAAGSDLDYSTYLGGRGEEFPFESKFGIGVDAAGSAYVAGMTTSTDFPTVRPVAARGRGEHFQGFATKLTPEGSALDWSTYIGGNNDTAASGVAVDSSGNAYVTGRTAATDFPTQDNPLQAENAGTGVFGSGAREAFVAKFAPVDPAAPYVTGVSPRGDDLSGGRRVEVTGSGFSGATAVRFGSVPARRYDVVSDTRIVAVSPAHPEGRPGITVTTPRGTSPPNPLSRFVYATGSWSSTDPLLIPRYQRPSAVLLRNGKVLVVGGAPFGGLECPSCERRAAQLYDPRTGTWSQTGSTNERHSFQTATLLRNGKVLIVSESSAEIYDPDTGSWSSTGSPANRYFTHTATLLPNGKVLVVEETAELYDPDTGDWSSTASPASRHGRGTATLLRSGNVLVAGGQGETGQEAELYDPDRGTWSATGSLQAGRQLHSATLLSDGRVLVAGGNGTGGEGGVLRNSAEIYDPATGNWTLNSLLRQRRRQQAATLLPNGMVLIAGGTGVGNALLDTAELWDPALREGRGGWKSAGVMSEERNIPAAVVLSSDPGAFASDRNVCGNNCGKVLVVGGSEITAAELYSLPAAAAGPPVDQPPPPAGQPAARRPSARVARVPRACASRSFRAQVAVDAPAGVRSVRVSLDGRRIVTSRRSRFSVRISVRRLRPGRHRLTVLATDAAGNRIRTSRRFRVCAARPRFTG